MRPSKVSLGRVSEAQIRREPVSGESQPGLGVDSVETDLSASLTRCCRVGSLDAANCERQCRRITYLAISVPVRF